MKAFQAVHAKYPKWGGGHKARDWAWALQDWIGGLWQKRLRWTD